MELPVIILLLILILLTQALLCWVIISIEKWIAVLTGLEPEDSTEEPAKVTDPFTKPKPVYSSTSHIVVPKTPTEIRNQNFKKIKEGVEYGDIRRD